MVKTTTKLSIFSSLEKNVFTLSTISLGLFGFSSTLGKDIPKERILCKLGAVIVIFIAIAQLIVTNRLLVKNKDKALLKFMINSSKLYILILCILSVLFIYNIIYHDIL
tara:strand:- start:238 stop:564 length:327 start_codon:yes stop_codon:yes gene_type:complete